MRDSNMPVKQGECCIIDLRGSARLAKQWERGGQRARCARESFDACGKERSWGGGARNCLRG